MEMAPEFWGSLPGVVVGIGGILLGWRKAKSDPEKTSTPAEMVDAVFDTYAELLEQTRGEMAALRLEIAELRNKNHSLRNEVAQLRMELHMARVHQCGDSS